MSTNWDEGFELWRRSFLKKQGDDEDFRGLSKQWMQSSVNHKYSYQFDWLGVPIIQMPSDLLIFQDLIWKTKPDLIIETGVARGGSLIFWASMQKLCGVEGKVLGIDIDIRQHARAAIYGSSFKDQIELIEGGSTEQFVVDQVLEFSKRFENIMVVLDSNHTHEHVLKELNLYANLVSKDSILLVLDTAIDELEPDPERSWGPGASPMSAVLEYMNGNESQFKNLSDIENRSMLSVAPKGIWLKM